MEKEVITIHCIIDDTLKFFIKKGKKKRGKDKMD